METPMNFVLPQLLEQDWTLLVVAYDTAGSAKQIVEQQMRDTAAVASIHAAKVGNSLERHPRFLRVGFPLLPCILFVAVLAGALSSRPVFPNSAHFSTPLFLDSGPCVIHNARSAHIESTTNTNTTKAAAAAAAAYSQHLVLFQLDYFLFHSHLHTHQHRPHHHHDELTIFIFAAASITGANTLTLALFYLDFMRCQ
eukprot:6183459-Pleurochrysis_carterae.AAC.3